MPMVPYPEQLNAMTRTNRASPFAGTPALPRFLVSGGTATALHWLVMALLIRLGLQPVLATAAGASVGLALNYWLQHRWAFRSGLPHRIALPRYLAGSSLGWALNLALFSALQLAGTGVALAQIAATTLVTLVNFLLSKRFVFHEQASPQAAGATPEHCDSGPQ